MPDYKTLRGTSTFTYEEKRSRFIATAAFADTEEKALAVLNAVRAANRTARHNVYAYVLQNGRTRYSDDGEPAKTAGTPVLETIGPYDREELLLIGDSLTSDMEGGSRAGIPCCWYNPKGLPRPDRPAIRYEVRNLNQVREIVAGKC